MKANSRAILLRAIEEGFSYGWNRAHKHVEVPTRDQIEEAVINAIVSAIDEVFIFETPE